MKNDLEQKLLELRKGYEKKFKDSLPEFRALADEDPLNFEKIYSKVHTTAGTSGMYGLKDLSSVSTEFELYLKPFKDDLEALNAEELKTKLIAYLNHIETIISTGE